MLSRTAFGLFWMSRYVERAENVARLIDAGRRMETLPGVVSDTTTEWASIVIAAGCKETFPLELEEADHKSVCDHLIFDIENSSSTVACFAAARENAREMRGAITNEVWDAINGAWRRSQAYRREQAESRNLPGLIDTIFAESFQVRGAIDATLLRDERLDFIEIGKLIERADATARLLDVKYNVLLPTAADVGRVLDTMQWQQILRAANALRAFRHVYREQVTPKAVVDLLALNANFPRSLHFCYQRLVAALERVGASTRHQREVAAKARGMTDDLASVSVQSIIDNGLHEWLTAKIVATNNLAVELGDAYGFSRPVDLDGDTESGVPRQEEQSAFAGAQGQSQS